MRSRLFSLFVLLISLSACQSEPEKPKEEPLPSVDAAQILFYQEGADDPQTNRALMRREAADINRLQAMLKGEAAEQYKCGYTGRIRLLSAYQVVRDVEFQLDSACRHLSWQEGEEIRTVKLSTADAQWLAQLQKSPWGLDELEFMLGEWYQEEADGAVTTEKWTKTGNAFKGHSYTIVKGDTVWQEGLDLIERDGSLYYVVSELAQNPGPVEFKLEFLQGQMAGFSNPTHDWPQRIIYNKVTPDSLVARVEGTKNGQFGAKSFPLRRIK
jgi:hypothetical protein